MKQGRAGTNGLRRNIFILAAVLAVGLVGAFGAFWYIVGSQWRFDGEKWLAAWNVPACEDPLAIGAPMDMQRATSKLYPGQVRGSFKPHGGLAIDDATDTTVTLYAVRDAKLVDAARYIENGVEQILLDFIDPCGIMYRYDHIAKVSPEITPYIHTLAVRNGDSRTTPIDGPFIKKGTVVATEVGQPGNTGFDLGVYDLRTQNKASKTDLYKTDQRRIEVKSLSFYAVCWFDLLPPADKAIVTALPSRSNAQEGTGSDYCLP